MALVPGYLVASGANYTINTTGPAVAWFVPHATINDGVDIVTVQPSGSYYNIWVDDVSGAIILAQHVMVKARAIVPTNIWSGEA